MKSEAESNLFADHACTTLFPTVQVNKFIKFSFERGVVMVKWGVGKPNGGDVGGTGRELVGSATMVVGVWWRGGGKFLDF